MTKGSAIDIPDLDKWMVIGICVKIAVDGDEKRDILVPCIVSGDGFVSGSLGYVEKSGITLVAVTMRIWSTWLNYGDCVVQKVGFSGSSTPCVTSQMRSWCRRITHR